MKTLHSPAMKLALAFAMLSAACAGESDLIGHWKLAGNAKDHSGAGNHGREHKVDLNVVGGAAGFDGQSSYIEVPDSKSLRLGDGEFFIALCVHTEKNLDGVLGDLIGKYDPAGRTGFNFGIQNHAGVTSSQSNYRHLHFGIDADRINPQWTDCGRPGNNLFVFSLCVFQGELYARTFEHGKDEAGHVYRYAGGKRWIDCGSPDKCNAVQALAVHDGKLYAGAGRYLAAGSALPESLNEIPGGTFYRYEGDDRWTDCGKLASTEMGESFTVGGMAVYRGKLYAGVSKPPGRGLYRYDGGRTWTYCGNPGHRVTNPVVFNGKLYLCSLDGGDMTYYDGESWTAIGKLADVSQTYGFAVHEGNLYSSSWLNGEVFRYDGKRSWIRSVRLGNEMVVMGMAVYNGKLYAGTLPLAEVYRYDGDEAWLSTGRLDKTPGVRYRRAWSMAVFQGKLFCGTLPSGRVYSIEAGKSVTHDHALPAGWVHLVAVRGANRLRLYVDGKLAATSSAFNPEDYDLFNDQPLKIGFGAHDYFDGKLKDVRIYRRALTDRQVAALADRSRSSAKINMPRRGICGHRGASDTHPENTLAAFREAIRLGAQMIEFDVALTKDGRLALMHDAAVDRTTDGGRQGVGMDASRIENARRRRVERSAFQRRKNFETRRSAHHDAPEHLAQRASQGRPGAGQKVSRRIVAHDRLHQAFLACGADAARATKRVDRRIKICNIERQANTLRYVNETIDTGADFIQLLGGESVDPTHTRRPTERNVRIHYCSANEADKVRGLFEAGVEFPLVDQLADMLKVADRFGIERLKPVYRPPLRAASGLLDSSDSATLGLTSLSGRHTMLYRATADGYKFCHHPNLAVFRDELYCMWSNGKVDEDAPGQRILYSRSTDGQTWTDPAVLTDDRQGEGICVAAGFHVAGKTLVAFYTATGGENFHPNTALLARTSRDGNTWGEPRRIAAGFFIEGPRRSTSGHLLLAGEHVGPSRKAKRMRLLYTPQADGLSGWRDAQIAPPELGVFGYTEPSSFLRRDGTVVTTLRNYSGHLYATASADDGRTWSVPSRTNFPDSTARCSAGNLPDGSAWLINNPMPKRFDRSLLTIALSQDGATFDRAYIIRGEPTRRRYDGQHKLDGWQYPNAVVWKDDLYVAYSINKEDVAITQIALKDLAAGP